MNRPDWTATVTATDPEPSRAFLSDPAGSAVAAFGVVRVAVEEIAALRKAPGPLGGRSVPTSLLKHADHQTVLALSAVLRAVDDAGWQGRSFDDWGLIAAPRFLGRIIVAGAMERFRERGVPSMSPLIIPTLSLHAVAGSLSLALKTHGFNYGVGGGHGHLAEALLTALAARGDNGVPGVWVVATQFSPEPIPDTAGHSLIPSWGHAVALALTAEDPARARWNLRLVPSSAVADGTGSGDERDVTGVEPPSGLVALADFLTGPPAPGSRARRWYCPLAGGGAIEFDDDATRSASAGSRSTRAG
jgi:hypothetical protein